ncbi:RagB/SusD family nutrient uptake outer membrane protein [Flavobacterium sp. NG2]|uniref:RagB/SusD family nutrient uptake outer membrane protein n=1 Tax=Flavobacterium sp. NG2 TaxID=3097547 RepID=UPI002A8031A2|nr:RagB/SusD family nutrient uptake outer membrane protein [Flavobacterium sp. NG2]WPR71082.1 RagB/SusD family nutrient uptake outer membrane protein [Flavobacterium sp. NG2]
MKKIINTKITVILALAILIAGCSNDFLDQKNPNETTTDTFWRDANDLSFGLVAVYNAFKDQDIMLLREETYRSDISWPGFGRPTTDNVYYLQTFNNSASAPNLKWAALYTGIFRANQVIKAYERIAPTLTREADIANAKLYNAEARALRGLFYFYLYTSFNNGSVPLFDFVPLAGKDFQQPLSPAETIKDFYIKDFEFALPLLPKTWTATNKGRMTAGAVTALLGQSYLYEKNYPKATELLKKVITDFGYTLTADIGSNFTTRDEHNSESILEINYSVDFKSGIGVNDAQQVSNSLGSLMTPAPVGGFRSLLPSSWLVMEYKNEKPDVTDPRNVAVAADGTTKVRKYSLRASQSLALVDDEFTPYYQRPTAGEATIFNSNETAYFRKYSNWDIVSNEKLVASSFYRSGINYRVLRLADVYLMYAEALIAGGTNNAGVEEALLYINKVRRRSAVQLLGPIGSGEFPSNDHNDITYTAQTLMNHLMYVERPLELAFEGHAIRTIDMRRWGIAKTRFQELATRRYYATHYTFKNSTGANVTRWTSVLHNASESPTTPIDPNFSEFGNTAVNFNPAVHSYWPLPNTELASNSGL